MRLFRSKRARPPEPSARIVIDGEPVEGYELPKSRYGDAAKVEESWAAYAAARHEQARTFGQRALTAFLRSARARRDVEMADALEQIAQDPEFVRRLFPPHDPLDAYIAALHDAAAWLRDGRPDDGERFCRMCKRPEGQPHDQFCPWGGGASTTQSGRGEVQTVTREQTYKRAPGTLRHTE